MAAAAGLQGSAGRLRISHRSSGRAPGGRGGQVGRRARADPRGAADHLFEALRLPGRAPGQLQRAPAKGRHPPHGPGFCRWVLRVLCVLCGESRWSECGWSECGWGECGWGECRWGECGWGECGWGECGAGAVRMNVLAVIPARGGSKGVPRKNLRDVGGRPLIAWSTDLGKAAVADGLVRRAIV